MNPNDLSRRIDSIKNTGEVIAQSLKEMIYEGKLRPGHPLKQDVIAAMFGVSRVPVRDALNMLINMRLAVNVPRRGVIVHPLSKKLIEELFAVRCILEGAAIRIVADRLTPAAWDELAGYIKQQRKALKKADVAKAEELDEGFHRSIFRFTDNGALGELIYANWLRIKQARCSSSMVVPENGIKWIQHSIQRHLDLLAALKTRDKNTAYRIAVDNINSSLKEVLSCLEAMGWLADQR